MGREKRYGMEIIMTQNTILLLFIAAASFCFGLLNCIQVPMTAEIGSKIPIRCNTAHPETRYHFSWKRVVGGFAVAILCVTLSLFVK